MENFVEELRWREMVHDLMPGTEESLLKQPAVGYIGFDPTAPSLTVGNLVALMLLKHFQSAGHTPIVVMGGATGMIGDPSGKAEERKLLSFDIIVENMEKQKAQFSKFLDFNPSRPNAAIIVNNYDWFREVTLLDFLREVGKHLSVNYMLAKDSVKSRLESGISFTEFSYQLLQGYDYYHLNQAMNCTLQMGGSDQWGNITAGTELIRRMGGGEAFALTTPLLTKADGTKFGKSEQGNVWLDENLTSPYQFYQFWINSSDLDAARFLRYFTTLGRAEISRLEEDQRAAPHLRLIQKYVAEELTIRVHGRRQFEAAFQVSEVLFGNSGPESLLFMTSTPRESWIKNFSGVPQFTLSRGIFSGPNPKVSLVELLAVHTPIFASKGEARKMITGGGLIVNKMKVTDDSSFLELSSFLGGHYLVVQKGKKNYSIILLD